MTTPAAGSIPFAFALQNAGGGLTDTLRSSDGDYALSGEPTDADYKLMPVIRSSLAPIQAMDRFEREVDKTYHPTGMYKRYYAGAGQAILYPRLENDIAELLYGIVGGVGETGYVADASHNAATLFRPNDNGLKFPWMSFRRLINGETLEGEQLDDTRVTTATFTSGAGAPMVLQMGLLGITPDWDASFSQFDTTLVGSDEDIGTVPVAMQGIGPVLTELTEGDLGTDNKEEQPVTGVSVAISNAFSASNPDNELVVGKPTLDDMVLSGQTLTFQFTLKWRNPLLYRAIYRGSANAYSWSSRVLQTQVDFYMGSQDLVTGTSFPYRLHFHAPEVSWQMAPIELRGGGFLVTQVTGVAEKQATPSDYFYIALENDVEYAPLTGSYTDTWPTLD